MKLDAISRIATPKFVKNLMIAAPLLMAAPLANGLEKSPEKDSFERSKVITIHKDNDLSPAVNIGNDTVYPAVVIDKSENTLYFYDLDGQLDTLFNVGLGKPSTPTDEGLKIITDIEDHPYDTAHKATKRHKTPDEYGSNVIILDNIDTKTGKIVGNNDEFIHGTNKPESVGKNMSKGCIRMKNEYIEKLAEWVMPGQYVLIRE